MQAHENSDPSLSELIDEALPQFIHTAYHDPADTYEVPFSVYFPAGYSRKKTYPMVVYVPTGEERAKGPLGCLATFGALIWTTYDDCIVVVPHVVEHLPEMVAWLREGFPITSVLGVGDATTKGSDSFDAFLAVGTAGDLRDMPHRCVDAAIDSRSREWLLATPAA